MNRDRGIPAGWRIIGRYWDGSNYEYVACERDPHSEGGLNYVTWTHDLEEEALSKFSSTCAWGNYFATREQAIENLWQRAKR